MQKKKLKKKSRCQQIAVKLFSCRRARGEGRGGKQKQKGEEAAGGGGIPPPRWVWPWVAKQEVRCRRRRGHGRPAPRRGGGEGLPPPLGDSPLAGRRLPLRRAAVSPAAPPLRAASAAQVPEPPVATCQRLPPARPGRGSAGGRRRGAAAGSRCRRGFPVPPRAPSAAACRRAVGPGPAPAPAPARAAAPGGDSGAAGRHRASPEAEGVPLPRAGGEGVSPPPWSCGLGGGGSPLAPWGCHAVLGEGDGGRRRRGLWPGLPQPRGAEEEKCPRSRRFSHRGVSCPVREDPPRLPPAPGRLLRFGLIWKLIL